MIIEFTTFLLLYKDFETYEPFYNRRLFNLSLTVNELAR